MATNQKALLSDELLTQVQEMARAQNREPADLLEEAWRQYVEEQSWVKLIALGEKNAQRRGIKESDVDRLIHEYRVEKRSR